MRLLHAIGLGLLVSACGMVSAAADVFYQGKTVHFIIGYPAGGGYDTYSRLIASHIGAHLAGHPTVVAENMPGAVAIRATNYLYNQAPQDGTVIGMVDQDVYLDHILGEPAQLRADAAKFNWIGRLVSNGAVLFAWHLAPVKKIEDAYHSQLIVAAGGAAAQLNWRVLDRLVGTKLKIIAGYAGTGAEKLAMERGEIEAMSMPWPLIKVRLADWLRDHKISLLVETGTEKNADIPDVPRMIDLAKNDDDRKLLTLFSTPATVGRSVLAPPGLPPERVAALRRAFEATLKDPAFLAEAKQAKLVLEPLAGEKLQKAVVNSGKGFSPALIARAKEIAEAPK